jgi:cytochrome P450
MTSPGSPIAAVTHPDPYPYYASLVRERPLYRDEALGLWVASSAGAVTAVLSSALCRVRPPAEPVPRALEGTAAGEVFRRLVRQNEGAAHTPMKPAISAALAALDPARIAEHARECAGRLASDLRPETTPERVADFAFRLPAHVVAQALGASVAMLPEVATWTDDLVRAFAPDAAADVIARGDAAVSRLRETFAALVAAPGTLMAELATSARRAGASDADAVVANGVGFLTQAYEATAGLIGNTLVALARDPQLEELLRSGRGQTLGEVSRHDSPVQNTRRFLAEGGVIAGQRMTAGDAILVVLAAANRDPLANGDPARFDPFRADRKTFTFGLGRHGCPGEAFALAIASAGVRQLLAVGVKPAALLTRMRYRPAANTRIPLFGDRLDGPGDLQAR